MTTAIELTDRELAELKELTQQSDARAALRSALLEYIRFAKRLRLKQLGGKVKMENNWAELEKLEMDSQNGRARPRAR